VGKDLERSAEARAASVLVEAIGYLRKWRGKVVVVKIGGALLGEGKGGGEEVVRSFARDVVALTSVGVLPVVVHGGGPAIGSHMQRLGMEPRFVDGYRVTDEDTLEVVRMVLVGKVNREVVAAINAIEPVAVGLSGEDAHLIRASIARSDLGLVGKVESIGTSLLSRLLAQGLVPVIATIGMDEAGQALNVNADWVACHVAVALGAEKLIYLTDVPGVLRDPADEATLISELDAKAAAELVATGVATGGMKVKLEACKYAVERGVNRAHIISGRQDHAVLLELFTEGGVGTMVGP
jgi:acetylglutamate kinase